MHLKTALSKKHCKKKYCKKLPKKVLVPQKMHLKKKKNIPKLLPQKMYFKNTFQIAITKIFFINASINSVKDKTVF